MRFHLLASLAFSLAFVAVTPPAFAIAVDTDPPTGTIEINGGAEYTNSREVMLEISADDSSGVTEMKVYNGTNPGSASWEAFSTTKSWEIPSGEGNHNVSIRFKDGAGNENTSRAAFDGITLDTVTPEVSPDDISASGANGTDGIFMQGDIPQFTWVGNAEDVASATFDASDFMAGGADSLPAEYMDSWVASLPGPLDAQDDTDNEVSVTVTDFAGNSTTVTGSQTYTVDTVAPAFDVLSVVKQDGTDPTTATNVWYYYEGDSFRMRFVAASELDGSPLSSVKLCLAGVYDEEPEYECGPGDFDNEDYVASFSPPSEDGVTWELDEAIDYFPEVGGYLLNIELTDDAGNTTYSSSAAQMFVAAFGIDPRSFVGELDNDATTDWSSVDDFTAVPELVFSAQEHDEEAGETREVGRLTLNGPVNLTDQATINGLSNFGNNISIGGETMRIDSSALTALNLGAELRMQVDSSDRPGLIMRGNNGTVRSYIANDANGEVEISWEEESCSEEGEGESCETTAETRTIGGFVWDSESQTLTFTTTGFSQFDTDNDAPTVSALDVESGDYVIYTGERGGASMTFSERLSSAGKTAVERALSAGADHEPGGYEWSDDSGLNILQNAEFDITFANDVVADVADSVGNVANNLLLVDSELDAGQKVGGEDVAADTDGDSFVILDDDSANNFDIPEGVDDVTINVDSLVTDGEGILPEITINATTTVGAVKVEIPSGTTVTGPTSWSGTINTPTVKENTSVSGVDGNVQSVIEVGFGNTLLTFDKGVRLLLSGQAGRRVGYSHGAAFTEITATCSADSQAAGDALASGADCKIDVGSDLVIWTKHFSSFATFTTTASASSSSSSSSAPRSSGRRASSDSASAIASVSTTVSIPPPPSIAVAPVTPTPPATPAQGRVLGASTYNFTRNLSFGSRGADVTALQEFLVGAGHALPSGATGYFGRETKAAVMAFQRTRGLEQAGVVGPRTRGELNRGTAPTSSLSASQVSSVITLLAAFGVDEATIEKVRSTLAR